jgi:hypothetical protein
MANLQSVKLGNANNDGLGDFGRPGFVKMVQNTIAVNEDLEDLKTKVLVKTEIAAKSDLDDATAGKIIDAKVLAENFMQNTATEAALGSTRFLANKTASNHNAGQIVSGAGLGLVSMWFVKATSSFGGGAGGAGIAGSWICLNGGVAPDTAASVGVGLYRRVA